MRLKPGTKVTVPGHTRPVEVESIDGKFVWCVWVEDGQKRRAVFNVRQLRKVEAR